MDAQGGREPRSGGSGRPGTWAPPAPPGNRSPTADEPPPGASCDPGGTPPFPATPAADPTASVPAPTAPFPAGTSTGDAGPPAAAGEGGPPAAPGGAGDPRATAAPGAAEDTAASRDEAAGSGGTGPHHGAAAGPYHGAAGSAVPTPWGGPPPYGFDAPPPRRTNSGLVAALVSGGVLVVILLVLGVSTLGGSADDPKKISGEAAIQAGTALGTAPGLALSGTYAGGRARFDVTRAGSALGSYTSGGVRVSRVDIDGVTYLKASSSFWTAQGVSSVRAGKAGGTWTKAPDFTVELNLPDLSPERLAQVLKGAGDDPLATKTTVDGVQAIKMTAGGRTYYIAATGARRLLRIAGTTDAGAFSFDVTPLTASGMGAVFAALRTDVRGLANAYDPAVSVVPTSKLRFGACDEPGCTVSVDVRPSAVDQSTGSVRVSMNVAFRGSAGTVSTCSDVATARIGRQRTLSCRTEGHVWSSWYGSQSGRFVIHAGATFSASVNSASDVAALLDKLTREQRGG